MYVKVQLIKPRTIDIAIFRCLLCSWLALN